MCAVKCLPFINRFDSCSKTIFLCRFFVFLFILSVSSVLKTRSSINRSLTSHEKNEIQNLKRETKAVLTIIYT